MFGRESIVACDLCGVRRCRAAFEVAPRHPITH